MNVGSEKWWSGSVNVGITKALEGNFKYALILNDDLNLPENLISKLVELAQQHPEAIVSAAQSKEGKLFLGQIVVGLFKSRQEVISPRKNIVDIDLINGCCLIVPINIFRKIGIINEVHCPHLAGDNEFLLRARNAGFRLLVATEVIIEQGASTDLRSLYCLRKLLTAPYSPFRLDTHLAFGRQLFGSWLGLCIFGIWFNMRYLLSLIKASLISIFLNRCI
jgi:GT2 family glycosyltransferase